MRHLSHQQTMFFMAGCLLFAAALRLPNLLIAPPGFHFDEATNALLSANIGLNGDRPVFTSGFTGQEPLFFYLAGGMMSLIGRSVFALRLTSAFLGILTIAMTYWMGQEMLGDRRISLIAATLLAVSFWHLLFSRLGLRAISQPLLQALTIAALFRGLNRHNKYWLVLGGVFLGLTAYTYLAARLFPVILLLASGPLLLNRVTYRWRWGQLLLCGGVALVVLAPLLSYFWAHPDAFWVRVNQVAPGETGLSIGEGYLKSLGMLFIQGDPYWRFNLPGRPLLDWFWGGLLVVGWLLCIRRLPRLTADVHRSALLLLLSAPFIMLLATALATNEIVPSNLRALGLIPFLFYLPAIGLVFLFQDLEAWFGTPPPGYAVLATGGLVLVLNGFSTAQLYFDHWAVEPFVYYESDGDLAAAAQFLDDLNTADKTVYVASLHYQHPTLAFLSSYYDHIKWLPGSQALVFPSQGTAVYIYPHSSPLPEWAHLYLETAHQLSTPVGPDDQPAFKAYELTPPLAFSIPSPVAINFGSAVTLLGYHISGSSAGTELPLTLYWRVDGVPSANFTPFVHLEDGWHHRWEQVETFAYPVTQWTPGETIVQRIDMPVPPGTPPGSYRLRVGLFDQGSGERLPVLDENGRYAGDSWVIENIPISAGEPSGQLPDPPFRLNQSVLPGLNLLGYERGATTATTGETIGLALWWQAGEPLPYLNARFELYLANNTGYILANSQPVYGTYPFHLWSVPQFVIDHQALRIPTDFPPGEYTLSLRLMDLNDKTLATADLGPLAIEATERQFTSPFLQHPLAATLGNEIALLGYDFVPAEVAGQFALSLVWQAKTVPTADYTVFVHVLDESGVCCLWQQDAMPRQNQYPTTRWLPNEVVIDNYQIILPEGIAPGRYLVEVGLYLAENGRRLQVTTPGQENSDVILLPALDFAADK